MEQTAIEPISAQDSHASSAKIPRGKQPTAVATKRFEPPHRILEELKPVELKATAVSDHPRYECGINNVQFKNTLMFQTRSFSLPLKNACHSSLDISWYIVAADEKDEDLEPPFSIDPEVCSIPPGETKVITETSRDRIGDSVALW
jgi:hydrocephalus-inducing protein